MGKTRDAIELFREYIYQRPFLIQVLRTPAVVSASVLC